MPSVDIFGDDDDLKDSDKEDPSLPPTDSPTSYYDYHHKDPKTGKFMTRTEARIAEAWLRAHPATPTNSPTSNYEYHLAKSYKRRKALGSH
jgi:hypothetical protein